MSKTGIALLLGIVSALVASVAVGQEYIWQKPQAKGLENGDLAWAPTEFEFQAGDTVRYIDFESGDDSNDGATKATAWKHHPWDPNATGKAADAQGPITYVFKRGVVYRGRLRPDESGEPGNPIRLTSDPRWGTGDAAIYGSESVSDWKKLTAAEAPDGMPNPEKVWYADLEFAPRAVWMVEQDIPLRDVPRIPLARTPNWTVSDPYNVRSEWWAWENPQWWNRDYTVTVNGRKMHQGIDTKNLTEEADYYEGALVWSEWAIMMGAPYAAPVEEFYPDKRSVAFQGPWHRASQKIVSNNRYYLEDKPHYLDVDGEYWFDKQNGGGRLYIRLPDDRDPADVTVEAARHINFIDSKGIAHLDVSGLTFAFGNIFWRLDFRFFQHEDVDGAAVRILGDADDVNIHHNKFYHVVKAVRIQAGGGTRMGHIAVTDNDVAYTDHGAIHVRARGGHIERADILRNRLFEIGARPLRPNGHFALKISYMKVANIGGNFIDRCYAAGIDMHAGKGGGGGDAPFTRFVVWNNRVTNSVLGANDWGGIETWQGGPFYIYNNVSGNALGPMNWTGKTFSHAYYLDGAFKNYHFNNIGWGRIADPGRKGISNVSGFQEIHSYQNTFFNNTMYNFLKGSRRQKPEPGRDKFLGNVFYSIAETVFRHSDKEGEDPNVHHAGEQEAVFDYYTNAYHNNVMYDIGDVIANFHAQGGDFRELKQLREAMEAVKPLAGNVGVMAERSPLRDPANHDFRPEPGTEVIDRGVRAFVPWSLYATVGEWNFYRNNVDPANVIDEHWYLTDYHTSRETYEERPMYPLTGKNVAGEDYVQGPLEDWTDGALELNGEDQYLVLTQQTLARPYEYKGKVLKQSGGWGQVKMPKTMKVGKAAPVEITLNDPPAGQMIGAHLHWVKDQGFGGFNAWGGPEKKIAGKGPYTWKFTPEEKPGLAAFVLTVFISPDGNFGNATKTARIRVEPGTGEDTQTADLGGDEKPRRETISVAGAELKNPQVHDTSFIVEVYFKTEPGARGVLVRKMDDEAGYALSINEGGHPVFEIASGGRKAGATAVPTVNDGEWHHVLAECSREDGELTIYVDGEAAGTTDALSADASLANEADLYVGGTPDGGNMAVTLDFMRVALGTLEQSRTTIDELHAWQFDGPFLRDFLGREVQGKREAGALELH